MLTRIRSQVPLLVTTLLRWLDPRPRRPGRRGTFLAFLALLDAIYGYSLLAYPSAPGRINQYPVLPVYSWAIIWIAAAAVCASGILARIDRMQYSVAATLKAAWGLRYAWLWYQQVPLAWAAMVIWLSFAATILVISGWPEPLTVPELPAVSESRPGKPDGIP